LKSLTRLDTHHSRAVPSVVSGKRLYSVSISALTERCISAERKQMSEENEINKAIVEHVFRKTVLPAFETYGRKISMSKPAWGDYQEVFVESMSLIKIPDFCNDLNAGFDAFEAFPDHAKQLGFQDIQEGKASILYLGERTYTGIAETYSKALCLAMLRAKGIKD
jgi:hypothetical protein